MWDQSGIYSLDAMSGIHNAKNLFHQGCLIAALPSA